METPKTLNFTTDNAYLFPEMCIAFFYSNKGVTNAAELVTATEISNTFLACSTEMQLNTEPENRDKFKRVLTEIPTNIALSNNAIDYLRESISPPNTMWRNSGVHTLNSLLHMLTM